MCRYYNIFWFKLNTYFILKEMIISSEQTSNQTTLNLMAQLNIKEVYTLELNEVCLINCFPIISVNIVGIVLPSIFHFSFLFPTKS